MSFISYAQNFEDVLLWRALGHVERGTYLDIGAQDPVQDSVSFAFYTAGWRGTHVEPTPHYAEQLRKCRSDESVIQAAVGTCPGPIEFHEFPATGLSTGRKAIAQQHIDRGFPHRTLKVPTVRLSNLLEQTGDVQWLKIDVEGMEADVLQSWDHCPIRPWVLVIEATAPNSQQQTHHEWEQLVTSRGYMEVHFDGLSRFFVHSAHQELAEQLRPGPNIFDDFSITAGHFSAKLLVDGAAHELAAAEERSLTLAEQAREAEQRASALEEQRTVADAQLAQLAQAAQDAREAAAAAQFRVEALSAQNLEAAHALEAAEAEHRRKVEQSTQAAQDAREAAAAAQSRAETLSVQNREAAHALAAAERDHRRKVEQFTETQRRVQTELLEVIKARVTDQHEHRRIALEAQQNLREAEVWRKVAEGVETELQRETLRWEKQVASAQAELRIVREQSQQQARAFAEDCTRLEGEVSRLQHFEAQVVELTATATSLQQQLSEAHHAIANALAQPAGNWQRLRRALGFAPGNAALNALRSLPSSIPTAPESFRETAMNFALPSEARNPYLRANSLRELLSWHGGDFVRCAYVTLLGRLPEPKGEIYYGNRINRGVPKLLILSQIRNSKEGRAFDCGIPDLDLELAKAARARWPVVGALLPDSDLEPQRVSARTFRSLGNQIGLVHARLDLLSHQISAHEVSKNHELPNLMNSEQLISLTQRSDWFTIEKIIATFQDQANG